VQSFELNAESTLKNVSHLLSISVVVFCRNAAATIERALASVVEQDTPGVELLVLDGESTDGTVDIIRHYQEKIDYWRSTPDGGPTHAINEGVKRATGDIICLLPADDWLEPGALKAVAQEFASDVDLDVLSCGTRIVHFDAGGRMHVDAVFLSPGILDFNMQNIVRFPLTAARFIRRRAYERFDGHDLQYRISNDFDFLARVCIARLKSKVLPRLVYTYRRHAGSSTLSGNPDMVFAMMKDNIQIVAHHLAHSNPGPSDRRALIGMHGRSSARLAWMLMRRGKPADALRVLLKAVQLNWIWPMAVPFWMARGWIDRYRFSKT
jgi:glycosyltransferase involved in cell wall biosynthesis